MSLETLRAKNKGGKLDKLLKATGKTSQGKQKNYTDEDLWYPQRDKAGNATAIIRFLPGLQSEDEPYYVELMTHGFKNAGQWYIENCPTTVGAECPVCIANGVLWDEGSEASKKLASKRSRRTSYYCNILVVKDPANPENEGKIFKFRFGKKILEKVLDMGQPEFDDKEPVDVFDLVEGANFRLSVRQKDGFANYDKSEFDVVSKLAAKYIKVLETAQHSLMGYSAEKNFKTMDVLQARFNKVTGSRVQAPAPSAENDAFGGAENAPDPEPEQVKDEEASASTGGDEGDGNLDYFASLAESVDA